MTDEPKTTPKRKRQGRSPSYPGIPLETAIQRTRQLYDHEHRHDTPVDAVMAHWDYSPKSGGGAVALAALKKYGLLEDEGSGPDRVARVTDEAVVILENPDDTARTAAIQRAALNPAIHAEMWKQYGARLPSDQNLLWELEHKRSFTKSGATEFIANYKQTLEFAGLDKGDTITEEAYANGDGHDEDGDGDDSNAEKPGGRKQKPGVVAITVPMPAFGADEPAVVELPGKLSEAEWDYFMAVLTAMKPGALRQPDSDTPGDES